MGWQLTRLQEAHDEDPPIKDKWCCLSCGALHDTEHEAHRCCDDDYSECWECKCSKVHFEQADAELCCRPDAQDEADARYHLEE